ncbi:Type 1 glutamine amidotransferase-like domain-containing protein [Streptomyces sp. NPDC058451]|uniref:Type 1 glutamine amidotransferase-like domain-containing protein n=1 Tax=Streptomyces sp. NPDC058451 TaxID=3346506 RepID=UPI00366839C6
MAARRSIGPSSRPPARWVWTGFCVSRTRWWRGAGRAAGHGSKQRTAGHSPRAPCRKIPHEPPSRGRSSAQIYLGGEDTGRLPDTQRASGLDRLIARHLSRGGLLCGGSAGAVVCGATILTAPLEEHSAHSNEGLNLLGGSSILPHYQDTAAARVDALGLAVELRAAALCALPENSGVWLDANGEPRGVGEQECLQFGAGVALEQCSGPVDRLGKDVPSRVIDR